MEKKNWNAISDIDQKIAFPLITVENNKPIEILKKIIESEKVASIVVGIPVNLDGIILMLQKCI